MNPLQAKINELVAEYRAVAQKIEAILSDLTWLNSSTPRYRDLLERQEELLKRIWTLKNNW